MSDIIKTIQILVVEDEPDLCQALVSFMQIEGFKAQGVGTTYEAEALINKNDFDIVILDVGLPDQNGIDWVSSLREQRSFGLIITTAHGELPDRIRGLSIGADVYLVKPVELEELRLVILNLARRINKNVKNPRADWQLNLVRWELITPTGFTIKLTRSEVQFLTALAKSPGVAVARDTLILSLGHLPEHYDSRRMEILTRRLRNKVKEQSSELLPLETVHGFGHAFTSEIFTV